MKTAPQMAPMLTLLQILGGSAASCTLDIAHPLLFRAGHQIPGDKTNNPDHAED
jgi:hypothetical protein